MTGETSKQRSPKSVLNLDGGELGSFVIGAKENRATFDLNKMGQVQVMLPNSNDEYRYFRRRKDGACATVP